MPRKNLLSLHEATIVTLINQPTQTASFSEIVDLIEQRKLSPNKEGNIPLSTQVMLRSTKAQGAYAHLFKLLDTITIQLKKKSDEV